MLLSYIATSVSAQTSPPWSTGGNATSGGAFLGTTNGEPLIFRTNNLEAMRIKPNGEIKINAFSNQGRGLITTNNNGVLVMNPFPTDTNQVFTGSGNFKSLSTLTGWTVMGNSLYTNSGANVGIGTSNPQFLLHVNGDAWFDGTVYATGVILTNKLLADTMKANNMFSLNNTLHMSAGGINEMYTSGGDLRIQSRAGYNGNTLLHAGTAGNVGIGTLTPQYKLDVTGQVRFNDDVYVGRIRPLPGDSVVRLGDSTILFWGNRMFPSTNTLVKGLAIGNSTSNGLGLYSLALGSKVAVSSAASYSIAMGSGIIGGAALVNSIPNSLMLGFNSDKPTVFVGPANGAGTVGRVGIGTSNPQAELQVGETFRRVSMGSAESTGGIAGTSYIGFNISRVAPNQWTTGNDFANNGASVLLSDIHGGLRVINISSSGATDQTLTDQQIEDNTRFLIRADGRVVIGNQTQVGSAFDLPSTILTVNGGVVCKSIHVSMNNWADSVFAPTYYLMPLDSVNAYVKVNGHLPGVPSQQEVQNNGTDLAQNDVMLLAKIEELTLYMIQLQQQNEQMKKEIEELRKD
jgi:hypothetical protein